MLDEIKKFIAEQVTDTELNTSKRGFIERFPRSFSTKTQVANTFAQDEFTGRYAKDPEYWKKFRSRIESVGKEEVLRVAKKYLTADKFVILVVGHKEDILLGEPSHPVKLSELGKVTELPLHDPLTMKPMAVGAPDKPASQ